MRLALPYALSLLLASILPSAAVADRSASTFTPADSSQLMHIQIDSPISPYVACELGEKRPITGYVAGYLLPPDDTYFTLLKITDCPTCPAPGGLLITNAHIVLYFYPICTVPVEVSILGAKGTAVCREPDQSQVICAPRLYELTPTENNAAVDFSLALPAACCIEQDAFLKIRFVNIGSCGFDPPLIGASKPSCKNCISYNQSPVFAFGDMCNDPFWPSDFGAGNPKMYVDSDCCHATPIRTGTLGRLKTMYR